MNCFRHNCKLVWKHSTSSATPSWHLAKSLLASEGCDRLWYPEMWSKYIPHWPAHRWCLPSSLPFLRSQDCKVSFEHPMRDTCLYAPLGKNLPGIATQKRVVPRNHGGMMWKPLPPLAWYTWEPNKPVLAYINELQMRLHQPATSTKETKQMKRGLNSTPSSSLWHILLKGFKAFWMS